MSASPYTLTFSWGLEAGGLSGLERPLIAGSDALNPLQVLCYGRSALGSSPSGGSTGPSGVDSSNGQSSQQWFRLRVGWQMAAVWLPWAFPLPPSTGPCMYLDAIRTLVHTRLISRPLVCRMPEEGPPEIIDLVQECMQQDPRDRPTMQEVLQRLAVATKIPPPTKEGTALP